MKYMLLIYMDEHALSDTERDHCYVESAQLAQDLNSNGTVSRGGPAAPNLYCDERPRSRKERGW